MVPMSRRMVICFFAFLTYGLALDFEKSYWFFLVGTLRIHDVRWLLRDAPK